MIRGTFDVRAVRYLFLIAIDHRRADNRAYEDE